MRLRDEYNIPTLLLMENAGRAVAEEAARFKKGKIAVFCGRGNNGGDGFVAARHLSALGIKTDVFLAGKIGDVSAEAKVNLDILLKLGKRVKEVDAQSLRKIKNKIREYGFIIDALLGVGLKGKVRDIQSGLIGAINNSRAYILSVDIPSGLDATTGAVLGCCVKAHKTVTFVALKQGMVTGDGPKYCGRIVVKDLGVPLFSA